MRRVDPVKHDEKRREILDAAGRCFARKGFQGATISGICSEAKISPGHLYHYFTSKEEIVEAMAAAGLASGMELFRRIIEGPDVLAAFVAEIERVKTRHIAGQALLMDMLAESGRNPTMGKILQEHSRAVIALLAGFLRTGQSRGQIDPGLDPDLAACSLLSVFDGAKTLAIRDQNIDKLKSYDVLKILIIRFLTPPTP